MRSLGILMASFAVTAYCRLTLLPRPQTSFSMADNPIAKTLCSWTRFLTFMYLPVFNFNLLLNPQVLSFDWGMDAIPRITSLWDQRNIYSIGFYMTLFALTYMCVQILLKRHKFVAKHQRRLPSGIQYQLQHNSHRKSRPKKKYSSYNGSCCSHLPPTSFSETLPFVKQNLLRPTMQTTTAQLSCICQFCKQEQTLHAADTHTSTCRLLNNNNNNNNNNTVFTDCFCHQLLSSSGTPHLISLALHKAIAAVKPSQARSSSSSSNSTTASNNSSGSTTSFCSSQSSSSTDSPTSYSKKQIQNLHKRECHNNNNHRSNTSIRSSLCPQEVPDSVANACVLAMVLAFLILPFLPATNLFIYVGFVVAERLLYLPSVGYCLLVGYGIAKLMEPLKSPQAKRRKISTLLCLSIALSVMSVRTIHRNLDWKDEESLYRSAIQVNPPKGR